MPTLAEKIDSREWTTGEGTKGTGDKRDRLAL